MMSLLDLARFHPLVSTNYNFRRFILMMGKNPDLIDASTALTSSAIRFRVILTFLCFICVAILARIAAPPPLYVSRLNDLRNITIALERYHFDHGAYPKAWFVSAYSTGTHSDNWIPGLAPKYIKVLPEDPRGTNDPAHQYLYASDGVGYKVVAHGAEDTAEVQRRLPERIDPTRATWAYGFWTPGSAKW